MAKNASALFLAATIASSVCTFFLTSVTPSFKTVLEVFRYAWHDSNTSIIFQPFVPFIIEYKWLFLCFIAKIPQTFIQCLKMPIKFGNLLHMCVHLVHDWCTSLCILGLREAQAMGLIWCLNLYWALYLAYGVLCQWNCVGDLFTHFIKFSLYLLNW